MMSHFYFKILFFPQINNTAQYTIGMMGPLHQRNLCELSVFNIFAHAKHIQIHI